MAKWRRLKNEPITTQVYVAVGRVEGGETKIGFAAVLWQDNGHLFGPTVWRHKGLDVEVLDDNATIIEEEA